MALAILRFLEKDNGKFRFACDIGTNQFFALNFGEREDIIVRGGLARIANAVDKNQLRRLPAQNLGRFRLAVSLKNLPNEKEFIQLVSYKEKDGYGVAWSEILKIDIRRKWNQKKVIIAR